MVQSSPVSSQEPGCMMYISTSMLAQAEALEKQAAQLKLQAAQLKQNSFAAKVSAHLTARLSENDATQPTRLPLLSLTPESSESETIAECPSSWQSPGSTPRARRSNAWSDMTDCTQVPSHELTPSSPPQIACAGQQIIATPIPCCVGTPMACVPQTACAQPLCSMQGITMQCALVACGPVWAPAAVQAECDVAAVQDTRTTLMMRNLPNDYTREMVLELLDSKCLGGQYNFFYLPIDFQTNAGLGYAFVNFNAHPDAELAQSLLQGFYDWKIPSHKILEVSWSEFSQGLEANIERYKNSSVFHHTVPEEFQPLLFIQGVRVPFPKPTVVIRQPRLKVATNQRIGDDEVLEVVDSPLSLTPTERINRTISVINGRDIVEILSHARNSLSARLSFTVLGVTDELHSVGQVCSFHRRLHDAIPDLKLALEFVGPDEKVAGAMCWRVTCTGTQVKQFIPNLPIDACATFKLQVTVKQSNNGRPKWVCWDFGTSQPMPEIYMVNKDTDLTPMALKHRTGECQPCAYFAFRADGCRAGDGCEFCHLCTKSQAKAKKKTKAAKLKAGETKSR